MPSMVPPNTSLKLLKQPKKLSLESPMIRKSRMVLKKLLKESREVQSKQRTKSEKQSKTLENKYKENHMLNKLEKQSIMLQNILVKAQNQQ